MKHSSLLVAYPPDLPGSKDQKKTMAYRQSKRALFFDSIDHVLSAGGFYATELFPQELVGANVGVQFGGMGLVGYIADLPEQAMVAGIYD